MTKEDLKSAKQGELKLIEHLNNVGFNFNKEKLNQFRNKTDEEIFEKLYNIYSKYSEQNKHNIAQNLFNVAFNDIAFMISVQLELCKSIEKELN